MEKAKQFIIDNDSYYAGAVERGYDIRMSESEILEWMQRYADNEVKNLALPPVRLSLPIILQLFRNAKTMPYDEYSKWVKSRMGYEA